MNAEYEIAYNAHNAALAVYDIALAAYRAGKIGDAEFLAARAVKVEADKAFDVAFEIASNLPEETEAEAADETQTAFAF